MPAITGASLAGGGSLILAAISPAGLVWSLQGSTDLNEWRDISAVTNVAGTMTITQPLTNSPLRFYRLRWVQ